MTKQATIHPDPLVMKVHHALSAIEPRPEPTNPHTNQYGTDLVDCPLCQTSVRDRAYNSHYSYYHGTRFWKEQQLIDLIKTELATAAGL
jgi:hypothetical protein